MDFRIVNFEVRDDDHYSTASLVLTNDMHEIEVDQTPHGLVVNFIDSTGLGACWWEDDKVWIDEGSEVDRAVAPTEWDENYWKVISAAEVKMNELKKATL